VLNRIVRTIAVSLVLMAGMASCANSGDTYKDAFARNRLNSATRGIQKASEANQAALTDLALAIDQMSIELSREDHIEAFNNARRVAARCDSRVATLRDRCKNVESNIQDLIVEWSAETKKFNDPQRKERSRKDLALLQAHYQPVKESMKATQAAIKPVSAILADDVLYLKHRRSIRATEPAIIDIPKRQAALAAAKARSEEMARHFSAFLAVFPNAGAEPGREHR